MAKSEAYERVFKRVIEAVKISEEEYRLVSSIVEDIKEKVKDKLVGIVSEPDEDVFIAGSFPRRTFLRRDYDIDIFIRYPVGFSKEDLRKITFSLAEDVLGKENIRARYAEHPYVEATIKGITINLVPSYKTEPYMWVSAVDRTYYHLKYLNEKLTEKMVDEVLLLKSFLKGIGCYGAEASVKGISGYLAELLTLYYGNFLSLVRNVANWKPPIIIDIEGHYKFREDVLFMFPDSNIIVVDPVDKGRNVASALSGRNLAKFISACKRFLEKPKVEFFYPFSEEAKKEYLSRVNEMKLQEYPILAIRISHGEKIEDVYYSQLERLARKIVGQLKERDIKVLKYGAYSDFKERSVIFFLLSSKNAPVFYEREGPMVYLAREKEFLEKNRDKLVWIGDDLRWHVVEKYKHADVKEYVKDLLTRRAIKIPSEIEKDIIEVAYVDELSESELNEIKEWASLFLIGDEYWRTF